MARRAAAAAATAASFTLTRRILSSNSIITQTPRLLCAIRSFSVGVDSTKPPFNMISTLGDWPTTKYASRFPGMDYEHWRVVVDKVDEGATKQQIIDYFVKTLAQVVGSEEDAKKKIYKVECNLKNPAFGCKIDWNASSELEELPGVRDVSPDYYRDPEHKDYGGESFVNAEILRKSSK